jgi:signal transduction histidine kinase
LTTVRGYTEAMADGVMPADRETLRTMEAELTRLERLVADLTLVARAEERHLHLRKLRTPVADLIGSAVAAAATAYDRKGVTLLAEIEDGCPDVPVDRDRIQEVLANLLSNALRYTPAPGGVTVTARRRTDDAVELEVTDSGEGIAAEHLPRLFERFYRADQARAGDRGGSGIGLAIARALVLAHDGQIHARSAGPGLGSTFSVVLPAAT